NGLREVALIMALDQVHDDLGVGVGAERVAVGLERGFQLAEVLDDAVQDDRELPVVAAGERVRVLLGDGTVRRPARVPEPGRGLRAVRAGGVLQELQIADSAHVVELFLLAERQAGRVVAAVLQPLEALEQKVLTCSPADVADDSTHARTSLTNAKGPAALPPPRRGRSAELSCHESGDGTTGGLCFRL